MEKLSNPIPSRFYASAKCFGIGIKPLISKEADHSSPFLAEADGYGADQHPGGSPQAMLAPERRDQIH